MDRSHETTSATSLVVFACYTIAMRKTTINVLLAIRPKTELDVWIRTAMVGPIQTTLERIDGC